MNHIMSLPACLLRYLLAVSHTYLRLAEVQRKCSWICSGSS